MFLAVNFRKNLNVKASGTVSPLIISFFGCKLHHVIIVVVCEILLNVIDNAISKRMRVIQYNTVV